MATWLAAKIAARTDWNDRLFSLRFACDDFPVYQAGQFTKIGIQNGDALLSRPYSLVSHPDQHELEVLAVPVVQGKLSPQLHNLQVGDELQVMAPATGFLVLEEIPRSEQLWMLATGTGVGPFIAILQGNKVWQQYRRVVLVYGVRYQTDLAYLPLLQRLGEQYAEQFHFVPVVSRETPPQNGLQGRIPDLLNDIQRICQLTLSATESQVMLCGNPQMIIDSQAKLESIGLQKHLRRQPGQISMERYW